ncbi:MAG: hypothetical protein RIR95_1910, partial [Pseudomonadota bacterium]
IVFPAGFVGMGWVDEAGGFTPPRGEGPRPPWDIWEQMNRSAVWVEGKAGDFPGLSFAVIGELRPRLPQEYPSPRQIVRRGW